MTGHDELSHLIAVLRGQRLAIGVDDVPRIATVLHHTRAWPRERRVRALRTLLGRSPAERERFDHIAPLLLAPRSGTGAVPEPDTQGAPAPADKPETPGPPGPRDTSVEPRLRWPLVASGAIFAGAVVLALYAAWPIGGPPAPVDAGRGSAPVSLDAGPGSRPHQSPGGETRERLVSEPSPLPGTFRGIAEASGVASLVLLGWSLLALRPRRRHAAAIERLARSPGRRTVRLAVDPSALHPIDRGTIATLAHMLAAPEAIDQQTRLDPGETIEQTVRNAGRLTLCFARETEQPRLILLEDVSRSMERWPAHAAQLARALEAQGQPVERRYIAGDPLQISERRSVDGRAARFEEATAGARVVVVSDGAHFDPEAARTSRHARALEGAIWLQPRPAELWRGGTRWLAGCAVARPIGAVPNSIALPAALPAEWRPPRPYADPGETADAWRSALGDDAYLAFAVTALLDLVASWNAALVWALISDGVMAPPWQRFERIWDLPELAILPGGRIDLAPELRDRLLADARRERPELVQRVAAWIDARLAAAIGAAGVDSLGAAVGEVYRDRVARAAGIAGAGVRVRQLAQRGLASVVAAQVSGDEREAWGVRDPEAGWLARLRAPLLGLALFGMTGAGIASAVVPAQHDEWQSVAIDAGVLDTASDGVGDAPVDAYHGDPQHGARVAERKGCQACHDDGSVGGHAGPSFAGMWGSRIEVEIGSVGRNPRRAQVIVDEAYVREKLWYPQAKVHVGYSPGQPSYEGQLTEPEILDLIAYLRSLADRRLLDDAGVADAEPLSDGDTGDAAQEIVIAGEQTYDVDKVIHGRRITIAAGALLRVRHGALLQIEADEIIVQGAAEIDGRGDPGAPGKDGVAGAEQFVRDQASFVRARERCQKVRPNGGPGGDGRPGAKIVLRASRIDDRELKLRLEGGAGGAGGRGAPGIRIVWLEAPGAAVSPTGGPGGDSPDAPRTTDPAPIQERKGGLKDPKKDPSKDAKDPAAKRSSPAPVRRASPSLGHAARAEPPGNRSRIQQARKPREVSQCPPGADGPAGKDGPAGSISKSSPDDALRP